jgi:hypothetical protein
LTAPPPPPPPIAFIKDKPSDIGLKDIVDKDSWTEAKKVVNTRPSFSILAGAYQGACQTTENAPASTLWEEVLMDNFPGWSSFGQYD